MPGDSSPAIMATALGGNIDGTLREYMVVPAHVCAVFFMQDA
jgi:threonine dehydrogenase-like Zn-dependent dehydrogenase